MSRSEKIIYFCEKYLVVPEGIHVGRPITLREWQKDIIRQIYETPTRQAIVSMGRKNGKTALIAMLVLAHLVGPEARRNGQIYSTAQSREQASLVFSLAAKMARMSSELSDTNMVTVRESAKELFSPLTGARYKALSADATTAYGVSPVMVVHDELGQVRGSRSALYDAMETAMGAQQEPLSIVISTQAPTGLDLLSMLIEYAQTGADPKSKAIVFAAEDGAALDDEAAWRAANPALGDFLNIDELRGLAEKALRMPSFESSFRNLHLNQRVAQTAQLFSLNVWKANGGEPDMGAFADGRVYGGLDLGARQDMTALVLVAEGSDGALNVWPHFWTPRDTLRDRAERDRQPYDLWVQQGLLTAVPGVTVDYGFVAQRLGEIAARCDIERINFDRWRISELKAALAAQDVTVPMAEFGQGFKDMAPALDALESAALAGRLRHGMHPVLTMNASNAIVTADPAGNRKLDKVKATGRIDGLVALAMAVAGATTDATPLVNIRALIG